MLLEGRKFYKPFSYEEFYSRWKIHERGHWLPTEISMHEDINDWKNKLTEGQKKFLTNIFRFFTQGDVDVAGAYCTEYLPNFCKNPEIAMFLCSVAAREAIHIDAYSYLIETLSMPESTYQEFLQYDEMRDKQKYLKKFQNCNYGSLGDKSFFYFCNFLFSIFIYFFMNNLHGIILNLIFSFVLFLGYNYRQKLIKEHICAGIALFSGFTEGMQLFSSFAMLLSFPMNGLMKGMGQIVTWSIVDETQHTDGMISLFKIFLNENSSCEICKGNNLIRKIMICSCIRKDFLELEIYKIGETMVELEDEFINLAYKEHSEDDEFMKISKTKLKKFIRFIANKRLKTMGYKTIFQNVNENPLPDFEVMINAPSNTNFFENKPTDYAKIDNGNWDEVWGNN